MSNPAMDRRVPAISRRPYARAAAAALIAALAACAGTADVAPRPGQQGATFIVVRHAEKAGDDPRDPSLLPSGRQRAEKLAAMLRSAPLRAVYATPFRRTQQTAAPAAHEHGLTVLTYDPAEPASAFAGRLLAAHRDGTVLVVGHSNTAPSLAAALCECEVAPMPETEYGRHYRLIAEHGGPARLEVVAW